MNTRPAPTAPLNADYPVQPVAHALVTPMLGAYQTFCVDASDLGLRAGVWPLELEAAPTFGNGQRLEIVANVVRDGELQARIYKQRYGVVVLHVIND